MWPVTLSIRINASVNFTPKLHLKSRKIIIPLCTFYSLNKIVYNTQYIPNRHFTACSCLAELPFVSHIVCPRNTPPTQYPPTAKQQSLLLLLPQPLSPTNGQLNVCISSQTASATVLPAPFTGLEATLNADTLTVANGLTMTGAFTLRTLQLVQTPMRFTA